MFKQSWLSLAASFGILATQACSSTATPDATGSGGAPTSSGGASATGGSPGGSGAPSAGGTASFTGGSSGTGTGGSPFGQGGSGGSGTSFGGSGGSGTSFGGSGGSGTSFGGSGGSGTSTGGSGGSGGGSGGASATFGPVSALLGMRCSGMKCHGTGAMQLGFAAATGSAQHGLLTSPIPAGTPHCVGVTLVTPNDMNSPLLKIVASGGKIPCTMPKTENIGPMPDKCTPTSNMPTGKCLTTDEIKLISDWIAAGAPAG